MAHLAEHLAAALEGQGRVAFISGDAGQGKTTLTYEFARAAQAEHPDLVTAGGRCSPEGDSLLPFREILSQLTGDVEAQVAASGVTREGAYRLWSALPDTVDALLSRGPDLIGTLVNGRSLAERSSLLPGGNEAWQGRISALAARNEKRTAGSQGAVFDQFRAVVQQVSLRQPLLLWVEDLHWADADSLALLFHVGQRLAGLRVLLIGTYRPEEIDLEGRGALTAGRMLQELTRTHGAVTVDLGRTDGRRFVDAYVDTEPNRLDGGFRAALYQASGGHPLFTVELLRDLQANSTLRRDADGRWVEAGPVDFRVLPARVDAAIGQRITRLSHELHALLSAASVQGEAFAAEVAAEVLGVTADSAVEHLSEEGQRQHRLVQAEGIRHIGERRVRQYRFRHALFQRYLYDRLDPVERVQWHEDTAANLERLYAREPGALAEASSQLAWHYEAAGLAEQAITYLQIAGERALRISAETDAIGYFNRGLALLQSLPEGKHRDRLELRLQMGLERAYSARHSHGSVSSVAALTRIEELCARLGNVPEIFQVNWALWRMHHVQSESLVARIYAETCLRIGEEKGDLGMLVQAHEALATTLAQLGEFRLAHEHFQKGLALYDANRDPATGYDGQEPGISLLALDAHQLARMGFFDSARRMAELALARARKSEHHSNHAFGIWLVTLLYRHFQEPELVLSLSSEVLVYSNRFEVSQWRAMALLEHGWALHQVGHTAEGLVELKEGWATLRRLIPNYQITDADHAVALGQAGHAEGGLIMMDGMLKYTQHTGEHGRDVFTRRARGVLLLMLGKREEAEAAFEDAIACAQQYECLNHELLSTLALCRLWRDQGKPAAARDRLAAVYSRFTEGFDVRFMVEARELLTELRGM
jgi:tetratricopeptide (TPR) repeat protein